MSIQWSDDLSVGVKEIDDQHQNFLKLLNRLYDLIYQSKDRQELGALLADLAAFANDHFKTEEKYFDQFQYELADEHKEEHRQLLQSVVDFQTAFKSGQSEIDQKLVDFLEDWLVGHLENQDHKYIQCFKDHGLS